MADAAPTTAAPSAPPTAPPIETPSLEVVTPPVIDANGAKTVRFAMDTEDAAPTLFENAGPEPIAQAQEEQLAAPEAMPEPIATPTPPAKKAIPDALAVWKDANGDLDIDRLANDASSIRQKVVVHDHVQALYESNPEFRVAYLKAIAAKGGQLTAAQQAEITPAAPQPTQEQIDNEYNRIQMTQGNVAAQRFWHKWVTQPQIAAQEAKIEADRAQRAAEATRSQQTAAQAQAAAQIRGQFAEIAKSYPALVKPANNPYGYFVADAQVRNEMARLERFTSPETSYKDLLEFALVRLKRNAPPAVAGVPRNPSTGQFATSTTRPPMPKGTRVMTPKEPVPEGYKAVSFTIVE